MTCKRRDDEFDVVVDGDGTGDGNPVGIAGRVDFNRISRATEESHVAGRGQGADRIAGRQRAPEATVSPPMVPEPPSVAPLRTETALASEPLTLSLPDETSVAPEYVLLPVTTRLPSPVFSKVPVPLTTFENVPAPSTTSLRIVDDLARAEAFCRSSQRAGRNRCYTGIAVVTGKNEIAAPRLFDSTETGKII